jgi:hypothetical protein
MGNSPVSWQIKTLKNTNSSDKLGVYFSTRKNKSAIIFGICSKLANIKKYFSFNNILHTKGTEFRDSSIVHL